MSAHIKYVLAAVSSLACASSAFAWGGTTEGTINAGGNFSYSSASAAGSDLAFEGHGGYYLADACLVGGALNVRKNDEVTTYDLAGLVKYHLLDPVLRDAEGRPYAFSPYIGARLGLAHGKNDADSNTGVLAAARVGADVFLTQNVALDFLVDFAACTAEVFPDDEKLKKSSVVFRVGFDFNF
jgi:hypothetical protein